MMLLYLRKSLLWHGRRSWLDITCFILRVKVHCSLTFFKAFCSLRAWKEQSPDWCWRTLPPTSGRSSHQRWACAHEAPSPVSCRMGRWPPALHRGGWHPEQMGCSASSWWQLGSLTPPDVKGGEFVKTCNQGKLDSVLGDILMPVNSGRYPQKTWCCGYLSTFLAVLQALAVVCSTRNKEASIITLLQLLSSSTH